MSQYREELNWRPRQRKAPKRKKKQKGSMLIVLLPLLVIVALLFFYFSINSRYIKEELTAEAGSAFPAASEFVTGFADNASVVSEPVDMHMPGDYVVQVSIMGRSGECVLHVVDTTAPVFTTKDCTIMMGEQLTAEDFVADVSDETPVRIEFHTQPSLTAAGDQMVKILVTDSNNNFAMGSAKLTIISDTQPPVISGVQEITVTVGEGISYKKGITVTDDMDDSVQLVVDNSSVEADKAGHYKIYYSATDRAGNTTTVETVLHIKPIEKAASEIQMTEADVNAAADAILSKITNADMSQKEIIRAIYDFCHEKIAYSDGAVKDNWVQGAYDGLVKRRGDCYTYAMSAKVLLTRAGITNKDIEKIPTPTTMHYWNLVDIGEGWHHFDTCRRADGSTFFYKTDAELMEYSNAHKGTHNYDRTIYTDIP